MASSLISMSWAFVVAIRPKQWVKNGLLFVAIIFSANMGEGSLWVRCLLGFAAFSCLASAGYLLNDILDREADRQHPRKCKRPIASGALPVSLGLVGLVALLAGGGALAWSISPAFFAVATAYLVTTLSYSLVFKHWVIVDVLVLSICYVWRAVAGAVAIEVPVSEWLFLCTAFLALFVGFNKRRAELTHQGEGAGTRKILAQYTVGLLEQYQSTVTGAAIVCYALYTIQGAPTPWLVLTLPFVLYGMFRFLYLVETKGQGEAPEEALFTDIPLMVCGGLYVAVAVSVMQGHAHNLFPTLGS
jgi:4-hydroxybenzoate polyprenyltransferase